MDKNTPHEAMRIPFARMGSAYERIQRTLITIHQQKYDTDAGYKAQVMGLLAELGDAIRDAEARGEEVPESVLQDFMARAQIMEGSTDLE